MYVDEIKEKLKLEDGNLPFVCTLLGSGNIVVSGVKNVVLTTQNEVKIKVKKGILRVVGEGLWVVQMGGGDMFLKGDISGVEIQKN